MLQEISINVAIIIYIYFVVDVAKKHHVNVVVGISILESDVRIICIHIFLILQALISNIVTIIYQYCDGSYDEKKSKRRSGRLVFADCKHSEMTLY